MNKLTIGLVAILVLIGAYVGYDYGKDRQRDKQWKTEEAMMNDLLRDKDAVIASKDRELKSQDAKIVALEQNIAKLDGEVAQLHRENIRIKETLAEREAQLRQLPPEDIVAQLQKTLDSREIWLERNSVRFSIPVAVEALVRLDRERKLTLEYVPGLEKENVALSAEVTSLKELVVAKDSEIRLWSEKFTLMSDKFNILDQKFVEYRKLKEKSTLSKIWGFTWKVGLGVLAGFALAQ